MRAVVVDQPGEAEALAYRTDVPVPEPGPGEVRLRLIRAAVNFMDILGRRGDYPVPIQYPWIPGAEGVGTVVAIGEGVEGLALGQRVACIGQTTYAEETVVKAGSCIAIPDALSDDLAAAFPIQGLTAWHILYTVGKARAGDWVVVHAAAGGVGGIAVQLARQIGCRVIGLASSEEKLAYVRDLGADHVVNYAAEDFMRAVRRITQGEGVHLVLDSVGQETIRTNFRILRHFGTVVAYGLASGMPEVSVQRDLFPKSLGLHAFSLYNVFLYPELFRDSCNALIAMLLDGSLRLHIDAVLPLSEVREAHRRLEERRNLGKVLLDPAAC